MLKTKNECSEKLKVTGEVAEKVINILGHLEKWMYLSCIENQHSKITARNRGHGVEDMFVST